MALQFIPKVGEQIVDPDGKVWNVVDVQAETVVFYDEQIGVDSEGNPEYNCFIAYIHSDNTFNKLFSHVL